MRIGLIAVLFVILACNPAVAGRITDDPNAGRHRPPAVADVGDTRLAQKITYKVRLKPMTVVLSDLTEKTGIKLYVGNSPRDWRVREDVATIFANDLPLNELMDSLARVMKFAWIRSGESPNWSYRLVESHSREREMRRAEAERIRAARELRGKAMEQIMSAESLPEQALSRLRDQNPELYMDSASGKLKHAARFLRAAPEVARAWVDCKREDIPVRALSSEAREALRDLTRADRERESSLDGELDTAARAAIKEDAEHAASTGFIRIFEGTPDDPYWGIDLPGGASLALNPPRNDYARLQGKMRLKAYEEKRPLADVAREMRSEFAKVPHPSLAETLRSYTFEEALKHGDELFLQEKLKSDVRSKRISALMFELAEATGLSVITDDFRGTNYFCSVPKDHEVKEALARITNTSRLMNWSNSGSVIEIWNRDWYRRRHGRVSQEWLSGIRERFRTNGTLDLDDLGDVASLSDDQLQRNIHADKVLRPLARTVSSRRQYLRLYASLSPEQKTMLFSRDGLPISMLSNDQQRTATRLSAAIELPFEEEASLASVGAKIHAIKSHDGKSILYTLQASSDLGPLPGHYTFRTPTYTPPHPPGKNVVRAQ